MKFKLDENFGARTLPLFAARGHEVETVAGERLCGASDDELFEVCKRERRCLVTLDRDFADVLRFPPGESAGLVVLRVSRNPTPALLNRLVSTTLDAFAMESVAGRLWIVEPTRIRIHRSGDDGSE